MIRLPFRPSVLAFAFALLASAASAQQTERQYLSGHGPSDAVPWEFTVTGGRRAGEATTIPVPSQWELQGFGTYNYGQELNKANEHGRYRVRFTVPAAWQDRRIRLVFDGVMTDTAVTVNGTSAGPVHQGGFTQFRYDITPLVKFDGENVLEVEVSKVSANPETEKAERGGDYWVFGGIYRSVWLEATPAVSVTHVAIDARADGAVTADVTLGALRDKARPDGPTLVPETLEAQILDAEDKPVGAAFTAKIPGGGAGRIRLTTQTAHPQLWTAESPHLYTLRVTRRRGETVLHTTTTRFGFRTFEVRPGEGLFVNGQRVLLKGVCRHSFRPETGRALDRADCYADARLIRSMNMNAVRMSHYPPDEAFLEACDELGLYVLDELSGWQSAHGTVVGRLLVRELVERDVNHPSIILWDNGNEGGWNRDLDGEFALYDPQQRTVIHPWDPFGGIDTKHYTSYAEHLRRLQGPNLVMPTEILHALFDGGGGAGLQDYWNAIMASPVGAGMFIWDFADEAVVRTDQNGRLDAFSTYAADGIVGPHFEKEGSYYAVREIWSPVQVAPPVLHAKFDGTLHVDNRYDFTSLAACRFDWAWTRLDGGATVASGSLAGPDVAPHAGGALQLPLPANWRDADALVLTVKDPHGEPLWTWTWATPALDARSATPAGAAVAAATPTIATAPGRVTLQSGKISAAFDATTGALLSLASGDHAYALSNGPRLTYARPVAAAPVAWLSWRDGTSDGELTRFLATPQTASVLEIEVVTPHGMPFTALKVELSADGTTWRTVYDASRRSGDGIRYDFPPQRIAAVRLSNVHHSDGSAGQLKNFRLGHAAGRYPAEGASHFTVTSGTKDGTAWLESRGGNVSYRWTLAGDGALRLDYDYALEGEFLYHGITFDHPEETMQSLRWLGAGPNRVWQNRLQGTWLGVHENTRHVLQPGASFQYPEFEGFFAGVRWAQLETNAGSLLIRPGTPAYLRVGTPRISHPYVTVDFPAGDLSFLNAIPAMGSKFKYPHDSGPSGQPAKATGTYRGSLLFSMDARDQGSK